MGIPSEMRDAWINKRKSLLIPSTYEEDKLAASRRCTQEGVREGAKAAAVACVVSAVPTLLAVRTIPWAKHNLNYVAQALIVSAGIDVVFPNSDNVLIIGTLGAHGATISTYFITADKTILQCARRNALYDKSA